MESHSDEATEEEILEMISTLDDYELVEVEELPDDWCWYFIPKDYLGGP